MQLVMETKVANSLTRCPGMLKSSVENTRKFMQKIIESPSYIGFLLLLVLTETGLELRELTLNENAFDDVAKSNQQHCTVMYSNFRPLMTKLGHNTQWLTTLQNTIAGMLAVEVMLGLLAFGPKQYLRKHWIEAILVAIACLLEFKTFRFLIKWLPEEYREVIQLLVLFLRITRLCLHLSQVSKGPLEVELAELQSKRLEKKLETEC